MFSRRTISLSSEEDVKKLTHDLKKIFPSAKMTLLSQSAFSHHPLGPASSAFLGTIREHEGKKKEIIMQK